MPSLYEPHVEREAARVGRAMAFRLSYWLCGMLPAVTVFVLHLLSCERAVEAARRAALARRLVRARPERPSSPAASPGDQLSARGEAQLLLLDSRTASQDPESARSASTAPTLGPLKASVLVLGPGCRRSPACAAHLPPDDPRSCPHALGGRSSAVARAKRVQLLLLLLLLGVFYACAFVFGRLAHQHGPKLD